MCGIAANQKAHHLLDIVVRATQPILHRQKPRAHVLGFARNPAQDFRDAAQHRHLLLAAVRAGFGAGFQLFQKRHRRRGGLGHIQITHLGQLDDLAVGNDADEGINAGAGFGQGRQDGSDVFFDEDQVGYNDVGSLQIDLAAQQGGGVFGPFGSGVDGDGQAGEIFRQPGRYAGSGASGMLIQRDHNDVVAGLFTSNQSAGKGGVSAHNGPLPRKEFRR